MNDNIKQYYQNLFALFLRLIFVARSNYWKAKVNSSLSLKATKK